MPKFKKSVFFSSAAAVFLAMVVCFRFFGELIIHPDEFLFGPAGDGLKNYFTVAYHVVHDDGLWFNGMLYPYGDLLMFADGQPLLAELLRVFMNAHVNDGPTIIAIMNLLLMGSLIITAWCVHRLLVWNHVNPWFAVPFSLTIAFLSPQLARFTGHYALGYTFFVPMSWLLIASFSRFQWPWITGVATSFIVLAFGFLHPYYLFIFVLFLGAILGWELVIKKFRYTQLEHFFPKLFALVMPLVVFMVFQSWSDTYSDRPTNPDGMMDFTATIYSVFTPVMDPFRHLFHSYFFRIFTPSSWEGNAYIGLVASFCALISIPVFVRRLLTRKWKVFSHPVLPAAIKTAFIPSILVLLFSMGIFHQIGLNQLSDLLTPIKQFRSLGRIAWVFYYVFSVWVVYHLYVFFRYARSVYNGRFKYHVAILIAICAFIWMLDAIVNIKFQKAQMLNRVAKTAFSDKYTNDWMAAGVRLEDHAAIMPLPLQLIGSEKIGLEQGHNSLAISMMGSFSSGLPIVGGAMSRTSLEVTELSAQLAADSLFPRTILDDMQEGKKLLLLASNEPLNTEEARLTQLAEKLYQCDEYQLYSVTIEEMKYMYSELRQIPDSAEYREPHYLSLPAVSESHEMLWNNADFDVEPGTVLLDSTLANDARLNLSYWVHLNPKEELLPDRKFTIDGGEVELSRVFNNPNILDGWLFISEDLEIEAGKHHLFSIEERGVTISRIMLRNADETIIHREADGTVFLNNIPLK